MSNSTAHSVARFGKIFTPWQNFFGNGLFSGWQNYEHTLVNSFGQIFIVMDGQIINQWSCLDIWSHWARGASAAPLGPFWRAGAALKADRKEARAYNATSYLGLGLTSEISSKAGRTVSEPLKRYRFLWRLRRHLLTGFSDFLFWLLQWFWTKSLIIDFEHYFNF